MTEYICKEVNEGLIEEEEIIRCRDCKYYTGKWCTKYSTKQFDINDIYKADDDFCSMAERKGRMTRLIDADDIVLDYSGLANIPPLDFRGVAEYFAKQIDAMLTIDAIPISWIENFIDDIGDLEDEMTMRAVYSLLINEWRKENERKEE